MFASTKVIACALIFAQLVGTIYCGVYDNTDKWIASDKTKNFPDNAVLGGIDPSGYNNYVGRTVYAASVVPARVRAETGYTTYNTNTIASTASSYAILVSNETTSYDWVRSFDGFLERNMVSVGTNDVDERVYVCRAKVDGGIFIGTLYLSLKTCFIRYENSPMKQVTKYEVLVRKYLPIPVAPCELSNNFEYNMEHHKNN